jgi:hypothetical protein
MLALEVKQKKRKIMRTCIWKKIILRGAIKSLNQERYAVENKKAIKK